MSLKLELQRFSLQASSSYSKRSAKEEFTGDFLACFGWKKETPPSPLAPTLEVVDQGDGSTRKVGLWWEERRVLIEVVEPYVDLSLAWSELLGVCTQLKPLPHWVIFTNRRELHLYEPDQTRDEPLFSISIDELARYSEAFPFLNQTYELTKQPIFPQVAQVSRDVADQIAKVYRELVREHPEEREHAVRFVLQCIISMFSEDIGLLPDSAFTSRLYRCLDGAAPEDVLGELFTMMATRPTSSREVPYFNGGLFEEPAVFALSEEQLQALIRAGEADWSDVDPHIFGSVFQGIMDDDERHASGAHYTARDDIMRVVGPTVVEPWCTKIQEAKTLRELQELRKELATYRVLDPACGSGNFLYVTFRELYRLETDLLVRMNAYASSKEGWGSVLVTTNFHGIDINPFAVELARVTLNIAKKIAFDERMELVTQVHGQVEMATDPSLPLDNLNDNIRCADALFAEWPEVDAIVGNPPFLGSQHIRNELGGNYVNRLVDEFKIGVLDLCIYWFKRTHDHMDIGSRAGLVATSAIRMGKSRRHSLDHIVTNGGTITHAVSSKPWPGDAVVNISVVNWIKDSVQGPHYLIIDGVLHERKLIPTHLRLDVDVNRARNLTSNKRGTSMGITLSSKFFKPKRDTLIQHKNPNSISPIITGNPLLGGTLLSKPIFCIDFRSCPSELDAELFDPIMFEYLKTNLLPVIENKSSKEQAVRDANDGIGPSDYISWHSTWWKPQKPRSDFFTSDVGNMKRFIVCSNPMARPIFVFISSKYVPTNSMQIFAVDDDYSFGIIQSSYMWHWVRIKGGRMKVDPRYTKGVWDTYPWPQEISEHHVELIAELARKLRATRLTLMTDNEWSLRDLYQASEVEGAHPLKDAQAELDAAVGAAYGHPPFMEITEFLLELNLSLAEAEDDGEKIQGPGLPKGLDPNDERWMSDDCIEAPAPPTSSEV